MNGAGTGRVFDGVGAVSAGASSRLLIDYAEPHRSRILDYLFRPRYGANLQSLKVEIGGDVDSSGGAEPSHMRSSDDENYTRGYEWWLMTEAKRRNPNIQLGALAWGAPGWLGQFYSQATIDYIVRFPLGARDTHGLHIDYVGIWNETPYDTEWIKSLKRALLHAGLTTRIIAADQNVGQWAIVNDMYADPELMSAIDIVGEHYPYAFTTDLAKQVGKPLWDSEDGPWRGDWTGARAIAQMLNRNYIEGRMTKTEIWSPVSAYYDVMTLSGSVSCMPTRRGLAPIRFCQRMGRGSHDAVCCSTRKLRGVADDDGVAADGDVIPEPMWKTSVASSQLLNCAPGLGAAVIALEDW